MNLLNQLKEWAKKNPKKFYSYSLLILGITFIINTIRDFSFTPKTSNFKIPTLYHKSDYFFNQVENKDKEMEAIVKELKELEIKHQNNQLTATDSLRVEFLYNQYQKIKNEKNKL